MAGISLEWLKKPWENKEYRILGKVHEGTIIRKKGSGENYLRIRVNTSEGPMEFDYPVLPDGSVQTDWGFVQPRDEQSHKRITDLIQQK